MFEQKFWMLTLKQKQVLLGQKEATARIRGALVRLDQMTYVYV